MEKPAGVLQLVFRTKNQLRNVFWFFELRGSKEDSFSLNKKWIQRCPIEVKSETFKHRSSLSISNSHMLISPKTRWPKTRLIARVIEYSLKNFLFDPCSLTLCRRARRLDPALSTRDFLPLVQLFGWKNQRRISIDRLRWSPRVAWELGSGHTHRVL